MLMKIYNHPCATLGFYSSIDRLQIDSILEELLTDEFQEWKDNILVFDRKFNSVMDEDKFHKKLAKKSYDTYRNL